MKTRKRENWKTGKRDSSTGERHPSVGEVGQKTVSAVARLPRHDVARAVAGSRAIKLDEAAAHQFGANSGVSGGLHIPDDAKLSVMRRRRGSGRGLVRRTAGDLDDSRPWRRGVAPSATPQRPVQRDQTSA
jgi:hypothetical protein